MEYLLIRTETYFVDGHGSYELGNVKLDIVAYDPKDKESKWYGLELGVTYDLDAVEFGCGIEQEEIEKFTEERDGLMWELAKNVHYEHTNEDGYNCTPRFLVAKSITEVEYNTFKSILNAYDWLLTQSNKITEIFNA